VTGRTITDWRAVMPRRKIWSLGELSQFLEERREEASHIVRQWPDSDIRSNPEQATNEIVANLDLKPIELDLSAITRSPIKAGSFVLGPTFKRVPGQVLTVYIPFSGSLELLHYRASTSRRFGEDPNIYISEQTIEKEIGMIAERLTESAVTEQVQDFKRDMQTFVEWANVDAEHFNEELRNLVLIAVTERKHLLDETAELETALDIPITPVPADRQVAIPVVRKAVRLEELGSQEKQDDFHLTDVIYEDVLHRLISFGRAMERLPITARKFNEEGIRDVALFVLNANYQGEAAGEVFNGAGKTDITLNYRDRNAFIGEFKFWPGQARFRDAVEQLLSYTVWRDTKAALILLIKDVRATTAIDGADAVIRSHPQLRTAKEASDPNARRDYVLASNSDPDRHISVALLPIVIPNPTENA
jgi:hypothetical protein